MNGISFKNKVEQEVELREREGGGEAKIGTWQKKIPVLLVYNWSVSYVTVLGAKGKFSGGFDISAFGGIQGGKGTLEYLFLVLVLW